MRAWMQGQQKVTKAVCVSPLKGATRSAIRRAGAESTPRRRQIALAPTLARFRAGAA